MLRDPNEARTSSVRFDVALMSGVRENQAAIAMEWAAENGGLES